MKKTPSATSVSLNEDFTGTKSNNTRVCIKEWVDGNTKVLFLIFEDIDGTATNGFLVFSFFFLNIQTFTVPKRWVTMTSVLFFYSDTSLY